MDHIPTPEERATLAAHGITLQEYVPQQAWIALVPAAEVAALTARPGIRWVGPWDVTGKLSPCVQAGDILQGDEVESFLFAVVEEADGVGGAVLSLRARISFRV